MERDRWELIERLYHAALEHETETRSTFLKEACPDEEMQREVESLLRFDGALGSVFDLPAWDKGLRPGERLGPYQILEHIGSGGMGEVWKALDTRLDRAVAIKVPAVRFNDRFEREARTIAALNHPHICTVYDVGPDYLVMEYIEGTPLRGPLPLQKAIEYAKQILEALETAHRQGIVHRDLKPPNILVTKTGVKLLDFGIAKWFRTEGDLAEKAGAAKEGTIVGTPEYMAPEQVRGKQIDNRADIFAFGCVLYQMLAGKRPFNGGSPTGTFQMACERPTPSIAAFASDSLNLVLKRCLEIDPDQRWQNAGDLKAAIELATGSEALARPSRRNWIAGAAIGVGGALAGGGTMAWLPPRRDSTSLRLEIDAPPGGRFMIGTINSSFAISPDGRAVVYTATVRGKTGLWIRPLDGAPPRLVAETDVGTSPFWSPDGKSLAFLSGVKLQRFDIAGGSAWILCDSPPGFRGGSWTADGHVLLGSDSGLFRVSASGGTPAPLTNVNKSLSELGHWWPQSLPRGHFLYLASSNQPENTGIYAASLAAPTKRVHLLTTESNALYASSPEGKDYLLWHRNGALVAQELDAAALKMRGEPREIASPARVNLARAMIAAVSANGFLLYGSGPVAASQLSWFNREGGSLGALSEPAQYMTFRLSPDGRRIAAARSQANGGPMELWILDSTRGAAVRFGPAYGPLACWSPDGRSLVYSAEARANLFKRNVSGNTNAERLTNSPNGQLVNDWSRDGRFILYQQFMPATGYDLMVMELGRDGNPLGSRPWLNSEFNEMDGRFSPEISPHWIVYYSNESGRFEIYIDSFPKLRRKVRVSIDGGRFPQWRLDGRELFFQSLDHKLMSVDVKLGRDSVEISTPRELFALPMADLNFLPYEAAPDGKRFLVRTTAQQSEPLTLIMNWPALLKAQTPR